MFDPKASKQTKSKTVVIPKSTLPEAKAISQTVPSQDQIRERAYQLYESGGCQDGQAHQDWFTAEQQIRNQPR